MFVGWKVQWTWSMAKHMHNLDWLACQLTRVRVWSASLFYQSAHLYIFYIVVYSEQFRTSNIYIANGSIRLNPLKRTRIMCLHVIVWRKFIVYAMYSTINCEYMLELAEVRGKNMAFNWFARALKYIYSNMLRLVLTPAEMVKLEMSQNTTWQCYPFTTCVTHHCHIKLNRIESNCIALHFFNFFAYFSFIETVVQHYDMHVLAPSKRIKLIYAVRLVEYQNYLPSAAKHSPFKIHTANW